MTDAPRYVLEQPASRAAAILSFAVFLPAACSIFIPAGLLAAHANELTVAVQEHPMESTQVALGMVLWMVLFVLPVVRRLKRTGLSRSVRIEGGIVIETTRTLFASHETCRPLSQFRAIVHRIHTSIGGMQHELALIERNSGHAVVFHEAPHLGRDAVETAMASLGLPELKPADLVSLSQFRDTIRIAPMPRRAAA